MKYGIRHLTRRTTAGATLFVVGSALLIAGVALDSPWLTALGAIALASVTVLTLDALGRLRIVMTRLSRDAARDRSATHALLQQLKGGMQKPAHRDEHAQSLRSIRRDLETLTEQTTTMAALLPSRESGNDGLDPARATTEGSGRVDEAWAATAASAGAELLVTRLLVERLLSVGKGALTSDEAALVSELWRAVARLKKTGRVQLDDSLSEWLPVVQPDIVGAAVLSDDSSVFTICRRDTAGAKEHGAPVLSDEWGEALTVLHRSVGR